MLLQIATGALLLAASSVHALRDTAPFFVLSPRSLDILPETQIAAAEDVEGSLWANLLSCGRSSHYVFIQQPGVKASDISKEIMHHLYTRLNGDGQTAVMSASVPEVMGLWNLDSIADKVASTCGLEVRRSDDIASVRQDTYRAVSSISLPAIEGSTLSQQLADTDKKINTLLNQYSADQSWVIIFSGSHKTTPAPSWEDENQDPPYEMDEPFPSALHVDLKRDVELHRQIYARQGNGTSNPQAGLPLFEKYKFLSPAIFMGLSVTLLLGLILYVGITAIAGLEVSYFAFSKEMGAQAQKGKIPQ